MEARSRSRSLTERPARTGPMGLASNVVRRSGPMCRALQRMGETCSGVSVRELELGLGQEDRGGKIRAAEVCSTEIGSHEIGTAQIRTAQVGTGQHRPPEISTAQICTLEV